MSKHPFVHIEYPDWIDDVVDWNRTYGSDDDKMRLAIVLSRENIERGTGGPFGAAIFERDTGRLVSVGVNSVIRYNNCTLHGEMVAFMMAQQAVKSYTLFAPHLPVHELFTSCEPCAMCLGATLWSGVRRVVYAAAREDASLLNFDEGPVFPESYEYLEERDLEVVRDLLRPEAQAVLDLYRTKRGRIYNG
jgi:tRNA(Arg) A34 adenosine deaminase TadA